MGAGPRRAAESVKVQEAEHRVGCGEGGSSEALRSPVTLHLGHEKKERLSSNQTFSHIFLLAGTIVLFVCVRNEVAYK